jgi:uncharacterized protein YcgI (DUF1989 family)
MTTLILQAKTGGAWLMKAKQEISIINPFGNQVVDTWALANDGTKTGYGTVDYSSMEHTRSVNSSNYIKKGMPVVGMNRRPLFTMTDDTTTGKHDTQLCPCNGPLYADLNQSKDHRSCAGNFHAALSDLGHSFPFTPASLNLFMRVGVSPTGKILRNPPVATPGDRVTLRAETDIILVLSACPQDVTPINGPDCTPRNIQLLFIQQNNMSEVIKGVS